ncbi:MAG: hypothetical protein AAFR54_16650 [Planctomycetota bacterium]
MIQRLHFAAFAGALFFLLSPHASAQSCSFGDDALFTGDCCDFVSPDLPDFPDWQSNAQWISIQECAPELRARARLSLSKPDFVTCDSARYESKYDVNFGFGRTVVWRGELNAKYARTFRHQKTTNETVQVWRFLINGDYKIDSINFSPSDAQVPPSVALFDQVHFVGHVDYACDGQGGYDIALSLQHLPGCIAHGALSDRPATGPLSHPDRSYYLVAPRAFNVGVAQGTEPQGNILGDGTRFTTTPFEKCFSEQNSRQTSLQSVLGSCPCIGPAGTMPWVIQETLLASFCGGQTTAFSPVAVGPVVSPGLNLQVVGNWALPAGQYPEEQTLIHYQAVVEPVTPVLCNPELETEHWLYGVGLRGGRYGSLNPSPTTFQSFDNAIDLVNAVSRDDQSFQWGQPSWASIHIGIFVD